MSSRHVVDLRKGKPQQRREPTRPSTLPRREKRASPLRTKRRRVRVLVLLVLLLVIGAIVYGIHTLSYLPRFTIARVSVTGAERLEPALIEAFVWSQLQDGSYHFLSRSDIFTYPRPVIENALVTSFPRIKAAHVALTSPLSQELNVVIVERAPFAKWCTDAASTSSACYAMDDGGFLYADASSMPDIAFADPYVFAGGVSGEPIGSTFISGHMPGVLALLRILQQEAELTPVSLTVENDQDLTVRFAEGFALKASFGEDADTVARNLKLVLASQALTGKQDQIEYIDLRFGNRVYYKLKGEDAVQQ